MSLILEALKKSEQAHEQTVAMRWPTQAAHSRRSVPRWAVGLMILLGCNVLLLGSVWLTRTVAPPTSSGDEVAPGSVVESEAEPLPTALPRPAAAAPVPIVSSTVPPSRGNPASAIPPSRDELLLQGVSLPETRITLHVYDANPANRFVLLNGERLTEGQTGRNGITVVRVNADGIVLRVGSNDFTVSIQ